MKMERLIGILSILLQRERVTAPELAEQFEVSRRTIQRDRDLWTMWPSSWGMRAASAPERGDEGFLSGGTVKEGALRPL